MTSGMTLAEHLTMAASASICFTSQLTMKMKPNMKVATSNVNIKIHHLFFKQRILGVRVTIAQRKTSTRTGS